MTTSLKAWSLNTFTGHKTSLSLYERALCAANYDHEVALVEASEATAWCVGSVGVVFYRECEVLYVPVTDFKCYEWLAEARQTMPKTCCVPHCRSGYRGTFDKCRCSHCPVTPKAERSGNGRYRFRKRVHSRASRNGYIRVRHTRHCCSIM